MLIFVAAGSETGLLGRGGILVEDFLEVRHILLGLIDLLVEGPLTRLIHSISNCLKIKRSLINLPHLFLPVGVRHRHLLFLLRNLVLQPDEVLLQPLSCLGQLQSPQETIELGLRYILRLLVVF